MGECPPAIVKPGAGGGGCGGMLLGAHHRFAMQMQAAAPPPVPPPTVLSEMLIEVNERSDGAIELSDQQTNSESCSPRELIPPESPMVPTYADLIKMREPGFGITIQNHYNATSSEGESQFEQLADLQEDRRERERKVLMAEQSREKKIKMQHAMSQLLAILPSTKQDGGIQSLICRTCEYVIQLQDSVTSAEADNVKLKDKLKKLSEEDSHSTVSTSSAPSLPKPLPYTQQELNSMCVDALQRSSPTIVLLIFLSSVISPQRLRNLLLNADPGNKVVRFLNSSNVPNKRLLRIPLSHAGVPLFSIIVACLSVFLIRRLKSLVHSASWLLCSVLPEGDNERGSSNTQSQSQSRSPPPSNHSYPSTGVRDEDQLNQVRGYSPSSMRLRNKAQSKVMAYLHSEGIETRGRVIQMQGAKSAPTRPTRRRTTASSSGHSTGPPITSALRSRTLSSASSTLLHSNYFSDSD